MPMIKFDVSDQDPDESTSAPEPPPPGLYKAKILSAVAGYKTGEDGKPDKSAPRVEVTYEVIETADTKNKEYKGGGRVWDYVTFYDTTKRRLDQFLQAVGIATSSKRTGQFDPDKLAGKLVKIRVNARKGEEEYRPNLAGVWKWDGAGGSTTTAEDDGMGSAPAKKAAGSTKKAAAKAAPAEEDFAELARQADDDGDDDAAARLTEVAEEKGLDPDAYDTWADLVAAFDEEPGGDDGGGDGGEPEGPTLAELAEAADADGEGEEAAKLTELAEANSIDVNEYETWAEVATLLEEAGVDPNAAEEDPF
jgi:hypothetical protein